MKVSSKHILDFGNLNDFYFNLLSEEDYEFRTKKISLDISIEKVGVVALISANSILDLKIANSAFIKSLEVIEKTLNV